MTAMTGLDLFEDLRAAQDEMLRAGRGRARWYGQQYDTDAGTETWAPPVGDGLLTIQGERHAARDASGKRVHRSERCYGAFRRSITLPSHVQGASPLTGIDCEHCSLYCIRRSSELNDVHVSGVLPGRRTAGPARCEENDMTATTGRKVPEAPRAGPDEIPRAVISRVAPARPRLVLQPDQSTLTLLDGGWWPRSADPAAELPGLILALDERLGRITRVMLGSADWNAPRPRDLRVDSTAGGRVVQLGWFATMPAGLLTAFSANGRRIDVVTIPQHTSEQDAVAAMERAAKPANRDHAPAILAVISGRSRVVPEERSPHLRAVGGRSS
jgi:Family of unknown function (DUF5994)